jgi:AdoMet-dependent rRNA methyltransferase SPB1
MLRKKDRNDILDSNYNRYTTDDHDYLPDWFVEDERRHSKVMLPITKAEVIEEKRMLQMIKDADPKKVL